MKKLKELIIEDGLSPRKELIVFIIVSLLFLAIGILLYIYLNQWIYILLFASLIIVYIFAAIYRYKSLYNTMLKNRNYELIQVITYFHIYIHNGFNVYQSFKAVKNLSSIFIVNAIDALIEEIDTDKTVQPFINFANKFTHQRLEQLFVSIYQMIDQGENDNYLNQFDHLFLRLQEDSYKKSIDDKSRKLGGLSTLPLIGAAMITIIICIATVIIIGSYSSGF